MSAGRRSLLARVSLPRRGAESSVFLEKHRQTEGDAAAIANRPGVNGAVEKMLRGEARGSWFGGEPSMEPDFGLRLGNIVRRPFLRMVLGRDLLDAKREAIKRAFQREHYEGNVIKYGEKSALLDACVVHGSGGEPVEMAFLARRLVDGFRTAEDEDRRTEFHRQRLDGVAYVERVTIASPLYVALASRFS